MKIIKSIIARVKFWRVVKKEVDEHSLAYGIGSTVGGHDNV